MSGTTRLMLLAALWGAAAQAGNILPPEFRFRSVGPGADCDYATIDEALSEEFSCTFACVELTRLRLGLADDYLHAGQPLTLQNSLDLLGGFPTCSSPNDGNRKALFSTRIIVSGSASKPVEINLINLDVEGSAADRGGVLELAGHASVALNNTRLHSGFATRGGAVAMHGPGNRLSLFRSNVADSQAEQGGGVWCADRGVIDFVSGRIGGNTALRFGGGVYLHDCRLIGQTAGAWDCDTPGRPVCPDRAIERNTVSRSDPGRGGGVFLTNNSQIHLGALRSRTLIDANQILRDPRPEEFGDAEGGGIHIDDGRVILRNTQITRNIAPIGAAVSADAGNGSGSSFEMDRLQGTCANGTGSNGENECSLIAGNITTGTDIEVSAGPDVIKAGEGVIFYGSARTLQIRRTTIRDNRADCDRDCANPSGSLFRAFGGTSFELRQNLIVDNFINSFCRIIGCDLDPDTERVRMIRITGYSHVALIGNTFANNDFKDSTDDDVNDFLMAINGPWSAIGNIFWDNAIQGLMDPAFADGAGSLHEWICNVRQSDFDDAEDLAAIEAGNTGQPPDFVDPDNGDYRLGSGSFATNRCDDVGDRLVETWDVAGRFLPREDGVTQSGLNGFFDAGALERQLLAPDELDLAVELDREYGPFFDHVEAHVSVVNHGPLSVPAEDLVLRFPLPAGGYVQLDTAWDCQQAGEVRCTYVIATSLLPTFTTAPLQLRLEPDASQQCRLDVTAEAHGRTDVAPANNRRTIADQCDGIRPEVVFANGFE